MLYKKSINIINVLLILATRLTIKQQVIFSISVNWKSSSDLLRLACYFSFKFELGGGDSNQISKRVGGGKEAGKGNTAEKCKFYTWGQAIL